MVDDRALFLATEPYEPPMEVFLIKHWAASGEIEETKRMGYATLMGDAFSLYVKIGDSTVLDFCIPMDRIYSVERIGQ